jgi:hypothetical protein
LLTESLYFLQTKQNQKKKKEKKRRKGLKSFSLKLNVSNKNVIGIVIFIMLCSEPKKEDNNT